jgi:hypothetical protein
MSVSELILTLFGPQAMATTLKFPAVWALVNVADSVVREALFGLLFLLCTNAMAALAVCVAPNSTKSNSANSGASVNLLDTRAPIGCKMRPK